MAQQDSFDDEPIAARDSFDDDSALDIDTRSDIYSGSIRDSIVQYHVENGRTYHRLSEGKYLQPNDETEQDRMELVHNLYKVTFDDRLCVCPKNEGARHVLDVGTGTGSWALDYADSHPEAQVEGIDLSPIQPVFLPHNCRFYCDDIERDWVFSDSFDLVFIRAMLGSFSYDSWLTVIKNAFDSLEPGGYLEIMDTVLPIRCDDGTLPDDAPLKRWTELLLQSSAQAGRPCDVTPKFAEMMRQVGFQNVTVTRRRWPHAPWPRDKTMRYLGYWSQYSSKYDLESLCMRLFTAFLDWTAEEVREFCAQVSQDFDNLRYHAYWDVYSIYGQRL